MNRLDEALTLIDSLNGNESIEEIVDTLNKAYTISEDCLDAITLLSRFQNSYYDSEMLLVNKLEEYYSKIDFSHDDIYVKQYMRMLYELFNLYMTISKLPLALKVAYKINELKYNGFKILDDIYGLEAYFDLKHTDINIDSHKKTLIDLIYAYERSSYDKLNDLYHKLVLELPGMIEVVNGIESDDRDNLMAANTFKQYAYYLNRTNGFLDYLKDGKYD